MITFLMLHIPWSCNYLIYNKNPEIIKVERGCKEMFNHKIDIKLLERRNKP